MLKIERFVLLPGYETNTYLIFDEGSGKAALIDPAATGQQVSDFIAQNELDLAYILNTHGHSDHIGGNRFFKKLYPTAKLLIHENDRQMLTDAKANFSAFFIQEITSPEADGFLQDGQKIALGDEVLTVLHTPGHTQGGVCFLAKDALFAGDTLFDMSVGRTDLPGGNSEQLLASIKAKIMGLPDDLRVYSGHGRDSVLGQQKKSNPYLKEL